MRTLSLILILLFSSAAFAEDHDDSDRATVRQYFIHNQIGANQGLYSLGIGYQGDWFEPAISYGYTPRFRGGAEVQQINLEGNFKLITGKNPDVQFLMGMTLMVNSSSHTFFTDPKRYPRGYYPPDAYYFGLQAAIRHHGFYIEANIIDYFLEVAARNSHSASYISDLVSFGAGYNQPVDWF